RRQVGEKCRLLEDDRDSRTLGLLGALENRFRAVYDEPAVVGPVHSGEDLHKCRLAGAVLADETVHLAAEELDVAVVERTHGAEALDSVLQLEKRSVGRHVKGGAWPSQRARPRCG